jgi:hypothetical protein
VICRLSFNFSQQLDYFIVFNGDYFLEPVKLNTEYLPLILQVLLYVFQFKVYHLLELLLELCYLLVFVLNGDAAALLLIFDDMCKSQDLLILLLAQLLYPSSNYSFKGLLLVQYLFYLPYLKCRLLLLVFKVFLLQGQLSLESFLAFGALRSYLRHSSHLTLLSFGGPFLNLVQQTYLLLAPFLVLTTPFI